MGQRDNDSGVLQPRRVIGIEIGKHDKAGAIEDVGGGYRQHPTFRSGLRRIGGSPEPGRRPGSALGRQRRCDSAMGLCTQDRSVSETTVCGLCLGMTNYLAHAARKRLALTKGAPVAPEKADDDGTAIKKIRKIDETAPPA